MGDLCDANDIDRLMRSREGKTHLEEIRQMLVGRTIIEISFSNEVHCIATTLHLSDGAIFLLFQPSLNVEVLREEFAEVLEREYYADYPERRRAEAHLPKTRQ